MTIVLFYSQFDLYSWDEVIPTLADESRGFTFASGVGAWRTDIDLNRDGTFEGIFHDTEPDNTVYICCFKGKFGKLRKIGEYIYQFRLEYIEQEGQEDDTYYEKGIRYIIAYPYGFDNAGNFLLYCPGASISDMEEAMAFMFSFRELLEGDKLPADTYGLYNVSGKQGFRG